MRSQRLLDADFAGSLRYGNQHDVHQSHSADAQRQQSDKTQQHFYSNRDHMEVREILYRVEDKDGAVILGIEAVMESHGIAHGRNHFAVVPFVIHKDAVKVVTVLQITHGTVGDVDQRVHVFIAIGNGMPENGDHLVRNSVDANVLAERVLTGEKLLLHG